MSFPVTEEARHKVESALAAVNGAYFGVESYPTPQEKLAAYLYFLIKAHAFTDGNKRTAVLVFSVFCALNGFKPDESTFKLDELAVYIEQLKEEEYRPMIRVIAIVLFGWDFIENPQK